MQHTRVWDRLKNACSVGYIINKSRAISLHLLDTDKYETSSETHAGKHSCEVLWLWFKYFWRYATHNILGQTQMDGQTDKGKSIPPFKSWGIKMISRFNNAWQSYGHKPLSSVRHIYREKTVIAPRLSVTLTLKGRNQVVWAPCEQLKWCSLMQNYFKIPLWMTKLWTGHKLSSVRLI